MTIAKALLTVYLLGVILMTLASVGFNMQRPRNYEVSLWVDVVARFLTSIFMSVIWPIEIGRAFYNVLTEPADVVK